jgi:hypothetical protein
MKKNINFFNAENIIPLINKKPFFVNSDIKNDYIIKAARWNFELTVFEKKFLDDYVFNELRYGREFVIDYSSPLALFLTDFRRKI